MRPVKCHSSFGTFSSCPCSVLLKLWRLCMWGHVLERESVTGGKVSGALSVPLCSSVLTMGGGSGGRGALQLSPV